MILTQGDHQLEVAGRGGTVTRWQYRATHILYPQQCVGVGEEIKLRGGIPICLPIHGRPPDDFAERGLPQHGFLREVMPNAYELFGTRRGEYWFDFPGDDEQGFPYAFDCHLSLAMRDTGFFHEVVVTHKSRTNANMPFAPGLHPYFATPGGEFLLTIDGKNPKRGEDVPLGESQIHEVDRRLVFTTSLGEVSCHPVGYTHVVLWRDSEAYLCVEPVTPCSFGEEKGLTLNPGQRIVLGCSFNFTPSAG